jgi:hypothetical protein
MAVGQHVPVRHAHIPHASSSSIGLPPLSSGRGTTFLSQSASRGTTAHLVGSAPCTEHLPSRSWPSGSWGSQLLGQLGLMRLRQRGLEMAKICHPAPDCAADSPSSSPAQASASSPPPAAHPAAWVVLHTPDPPAKRATRNNPAPGRVPHLDSAQRPGARGSGGGNPGNACRSQAAALTRRATWPCCAPPGFQSQTARLPVRVIKFTRCATQA